MIAVISDVHLGNHARHGGTWTEPGINERGTAHLDALGDAVKLASKAGATSLIIAGDLSHTKTMDPGTIAMLHGILEESHDAGVSPQVLKGNHDEADSRGPGDHALHYLVGMAKPRLASSFVALRDYTAMPFQRGDATKRLRDLPRPKSEPGILIGHHGIAWDDASEYLKNATDYIQAGVLAHEARKKGYRLVLMGHDHRYRQEVIGGVTLIQIGALGPWSFSDDGEEPFGSVILIDQWDKEAVTWEVTRKTVPGPRFFTVKGGAKLSKMRAPKMAHVRFLEPPTKAQLAEVEKLGVYHWEAPNTMVEEKTEREETEVANIDVEGAIEGYVAGMQGLSKRVKNHATKRSLELWRKGA